MRSPHLAGIAARRLLHFGIALLAGLFAFLVYQRTLAPSIVWGDSPELTAAAYTAGVPHPTGYPLYMLLAHAWIRLWPAGSAAYRMNLLAALSAAVAVVLIVPLMRRATGSLAAGLAAALLFAFSRTFWSQALIAEHYCFEVALIAAVLNSVLIWDTSGSRRWLLAAALLYGLCCTHHMMSLLLAPGLLTFALSSPRRPQFVRELRWTLPLFLLPLSLYLYLPLAALRDPPVDWGDPRTWNRFLAHVTGQEYQRAMFHFTGGELWKRFRDYALPAAAGHGGFLWEQFAPALLWLAPVGVVSLARRDRRLFGLTLWIFLADLLYALNYDIYNVELYYLPSHLMVALWLGGGLRQVCDWLERGWQRAFLSCSAERSRSRRRERESAKERKREPESQETGQGLNFPPDPFQFRPDFAFSLFRAFAFSSRRSAPRFPPPRGGQALRLLLGAAALLLALWPLARHWRSEDRREDWSALAYGRAVLAELPPNALVVGDGDDLYFPLLYCRFVERRRPDVLLLMAGDVLRPQRLRLTTRLRRQGLVVRLPPHFRARSARRFDNRLLRQLVADNIGRRPIYLLASPDALQSRWLAPVAACGVLISSLPLYELRRHAPSPAIARAAPEFPRHLPLKLRRPDGGARRALDFLGYDLRPIAKGAGQWLRIRYYWRVRDPAAAGAATVWVLFTDAAGSYRRHPDGTPEFHNVHPLANGIGERQRLPALLAESFDLFVPPDQQGQRLHIRLAVSRGPQFLFPPGQANPWSEIGQLPGWGVRHRFAPPGSVGGDDPASEFPHRHPKLKDVTNALPAPSNQWPLAEPSGRKCLLAGPAAGGTPMRNLTIAAAAALIATAATAAWSLTLAVQLTPKALSANHRSFTITTRDVGEFKEFNVVMTTDREGPPFSPFVRGDLTLSTLTEHVALVRLEPQREGRTVRFWFRVSPEAIAGSRFDIGEQAYEVQQNPDGTPVTDEHGQPIFQQVIGGWQYGFLLRDFAQQS